MTLMGYQQQTMPTATQMNLQWQNQQMAAQQNAYQNALGTSNAAYAMNMANGLGSLGNAQQASLLGNYSQGIPDAARYNYGPLGPLTSGTIFFEADPSVDTGGIVLAWMAVLAIAIVGLMVGFATLGPLFRAPFLIGGSF